MSVSEGSNILLFGATGKTGAQICKELISRDMMLSLFVREESANKLTGQGMKIIHGDVLNYKDVEAAIKSDTFTDVIISLGSKSLKDNELRSLGTEHIMKALQSIRSMSKVHVVSALGVGESWDQLDFFGKLISNLLLKSVMEDHRKQEEIVMNSPNPNHIVRPVGLKDGDSTGVVHLQSAGRLPSSSIMRSDVAKFLVDSMLEYREGISSICQKK